MKQVANTHSKIASNNTRKPVTKQDPTLFTQEEYFNRIKESKKGPSYELKEGETLEDLLEKESLM